MERFSKTIYNLLGIVILFFTFVVVFAEEIPVTLAKDGKTDYEIVIDKDATGVDRYAASELSLYLKQITGADFPIVETDSMSADKPAIYVGIGELALKKLGENPLVGMTDQAYVFRSVGKNIFLYGKGVHGSLLAAMDFLETFMGWRWYSLFEHPLLPKTPTVVLSPFERKGVSSFRSNSMEIARSWDWHYQMGNNRHFDQALDRYHPNLPRSKRSYVSVDHEVEHGAGNHHTFFSFIPPTPDNRFAAYFNWQKKKDYFKTNPEFFSLDEKGQRIPRQLCFGNPALRLELTKQILRLIEQEGDDITVSVSALDKPKNFCYCQACEKLMRKYESPGGPLYDYLLELCGKLQNTYPNVRVSTIAYRRAQTQIPPKLAEEKKLPPNLEILFAPVEDCVFADWTHPDPRIQETYRHLKEWAAITQPGNLLSLYYGPWGAVSLMPFSDINRMITQIRLMYANGVRGIHLDQESTHNRGFAGELRSYLFYRLRKNVNADTDEVIHEFTDYMYGPAAPLIRSCLRELEFEQKKMFKNNLPVGVGYRALLEEKNFPYLTPENIHRWQKYFDIMLELTKNGEARWRTNVLLARRSFDLATLWKWFDLRVKYPECYGDYQMVRERIARANNLRAPTPPEWENSRRSRLDGRGTNREWRNHPLGEELADDLTAIIKGGGQCKPLPQELSKVDPNLVKRFVPRNQALKAPKDYSPVGDRVVIDPDAAFGYAATSYLPKQQPEQKLPFTFGVRPQRGKPSVSRSINLDEIQPGRYRLYKLGDVALTPQSQFWMPEWSCSTLLEIGKRLFEPGADNRWELYASLKFDGPTYKGSAAEDRVWCDQVILVQKSKNQFATP